MSWIAAGLTNAAIATCLALVIWLCSRRLNQSWRHTLWVLVLLKLVTPPVVQTPLDAEPGAFESVPTEELLGSGAIVPFFFQALVSLWLLGSAAFLIQRMGAFLNIWWQLHRHFGLTDATVQQAAREVGQQVGLSRVPRVLLCNLSSPTLFGLPGMVVILFPVQLWQVLDPSTRRVLLAHELGHYARSDHWVRLLETVTQVLFWWLPVVWIAARQIEAAEEDCCDSWVVHHMRANRRQYAEGILTTLQLAQCPDAAEWPVWYRWTHWMAPGSEVSIEGRFRNIMGGKPLVSATPLVRFGGNTLLVACLPLILTCVNLQWPQSGTVGSTVNNTVAAAGPKLTTNQPAALATWQPSPPSKEPFTIGTLATGNWWKLRHTQHQTIIEGPQARYRLIASANQRLAVQDCRSGVTRQLEGSQICCAAFLPDGGRFLTGEQDGSVRLWDARTGSVLGLLGQHTAEVRSVCLDPTGRRAVSGSGDGSLRIWDLNQRTAPVIWRDDNTPINVARFSGDGQQIVVVGGNAQYKLSSKITLLNAETLAVVNSVTVLETLIAAAEASDRRAVYFADRQGRLSLWDLLSNTLRPGAMLAPEQVAAAAFSPHTPLLTEDNLPSTPAG